MSSERFRAYSGSEPFVFISYAHKDSDRVYHIITELYKKGFRLWYDEGIETARRYQAEINTHIEECEYFLLFASRLSVQRQDVINEFAYASALKKKIIVIYLEDFDPFLADAALRGDIAKSESIRWYSLSEEDAFTGLENIIAACRGESPAQAEESTPEETAPAQGLMEKTAAFIKELPSKWMSLPIRGRIITAGAAVLLAVLCILLPVLCCSPNTISYSPAEDFDYYEENGSIVISAYIGSDRLVNIPPEIDGMKVTALGGSRFSPGTFSDLQFLETVIFPDTVPEIDAFAFSGCTSLKSVKLPNSLTVLESGMFSGCSSLKTLDIPASVTVINHDVFSGCSSLTDISIPNNVEILSYAAFSDCRSLERVRLPERMTAIGEFAFYGCESLSQINIPQGLTEIHKASFANCHSLPAFEIPSGVTAIHDFGFAYCESFTEITIPEKVTMLGEGAFGGCIALETVTIESVSLTDIGDKAFSGCASLREINLPEGLETIGYHTFYECDSLTAVTLPESLSSIGEDAFFNSSGTVTVTAPHKASYYGYSPSDCVEWVVSK